MRPLTLNKMKLFVTSLLVFAVLVSTASAQDVNYGSWDGANNYSGKVPVGKAYDSNLDPFSDQGGEYSNFACSTEGGVVLTESDQQILSEILTAAGEVYKGDFYLNSPKSPFTSFKKPPANGGYPAGSIGINQFVNNEISMLKSGNWVPYQNRQLVPITNRGKIKEFTYPVPAAGWIGKNLNSTQQIETFKGVALASVLNPNTNHPLSASEDLPEACALGVVAPTEPDINDLFSSPGKFQSDSFLYIPTNLATSMLEFFEPYAFRWTFWTPHSERSDLIWNIPESCAPRATSESEGYVSQNCQANDKVAFNQDTGSSDQGQAWYLSVAHFVQWLVSGTYMIIFLFAVIMFMMRGNRRTQVQLTTVIPRILGAMILTAFAGYLIGAMITFSNTIVQTIFNFSDTKTIGLVSAALLEAGNIIGGGSTMQDVGQLVVSGLSSLFFIFFVVVALLRQILLVMLIITFPLAAFTLVSPRWQDYFFTYVRALATVVFLPVILAFIFKVSLAINPLILDPIGSYGNLQGLLGMILILITFWLMYKAIRISFSFVRGGSRAIVNIEEGNNSIENILEKSPFSKGETEMVPAGQAPMARRGIPQVTATNRVSTSPPQMSTSPGEDLGKVISSKQSGSQRISSGSAKAYRDKLRAAIGAATARKGAPLSEEEVAKIKKSFARKNGGQLSEKDGSYYLNPVEEEIVRSRE